VLRSGPLSARNQRREERHLHSIGRTPGVFGADQFFRCGYGDATPSTSKTATPAGLPLRSQPTGDPQEVHDHLVCHPNHALTGALFVQPPSDRDEVRGLRRSRVSIPFSVIHR